VQGFNWESWKSSCWYDVLAKTAKDLAAAGITDVWLPPSSHSVAPQGKATAQVSVCRIDQTLAPFSSHDEKTCVQNMTCFMQHFWF
jgi:hypothetical protein